MNSETDPGLMSRKELGKWGEELAAKYLESRGYRILEKNYSCKLGEVDLIAEKSDYLVFCEVKTRRSDSYGLPQAAVGYHKQEKIRKVALYYLTLNEDRGLQVSFDVISIMVQDLEPQLEHFKDAF